MRLISLQIRSRTGWLLTDLSGEKAITPKFGTGNEVLMYTNNDYRNSYLYYWKAPKEFNGNLVRY